MKNRLEEIWSQLESSKLIGTGLTYRRYSAELNSEIFGAISNEERRRALAIEIDINLSFDLDSWDTFRDINLRFIPSSKNKSRKFFVISLVSNEHREIFTTLCEDLVNTISILEEETKIVTQIIQRLIKWQSLFTALNNQGLSNQAQAGLYGECTYLKRALEYDSNYYERIRSWVGPDKQIQDFQGSGWAVEIKTTYGKNHQKLHIANERQLDDSFIPHIVLAHYSFDIRESDSRTLNNLIDEIIELIQGDSRSLNLFRAKLLDVGYFDIHRNIYELRSYSLRAQHYYRVSGNFPRIVEGDVPDGVGDVRYSIVLSDSSDWEIEEIDAFNLNLE